MEQLAFFGAAILIVGAVATVIATWVNVAINVGCERRIGVLDTQRYELEKRICDLETWRES